MRTTTLLGALVVILLLGGLVYAWMHVREEGKMLSIASYEECAAAGYPIMESYPSRCATPDGRTFTNPNEHVDILMPRGSEAPDCVVGGCSAQLCGEAGEDLVSTCEFRPEYACYQAHSTCERQPNGRCGWTPNSALTQCLANPPAAQGDGQTVF
jgi:eight-cysteine-cluster-containing protein